ncbi:aquaporin [Trametopsis cervina]|nr:aquaporin [Trametopsis cervina]
MSSQTRDYASYPTKDSSVDDKPDIRHREDISQIEKDAGSSGNTYGEYGPRTTYTGRWGRLRYVVLASCYDFSPDHKRSSYFQEPAIPPGEIITKYPNRWSRPRELFREAMAEFIGTMVLIIFGCGVNCQVTLSGNIAVSPGGNRGEWISIVIGWGAAVAVGVWIAGGISGGHINPAVTIAFATFRDFPWRKVPVFVTAQVLGAFVGACIVYGNYLGAINVAEGGGGIRTIPGQFDGAAGTAGMFATYALGYMTNIRCFFDEFLGTAVLLIFVCAITDQNNGPPPAGLVPLGLFFVICAVGTSLGMQTGYAINPARDFGPRVMTAMVGYGHHPFSYRNQYWIWCPIIAPICGALAGIAFYDVFLFLGCESIVNRADKRARAAHAHAMAAERTKPGISGVEFV